MVGTWHQRTFPYPLLATWTGDYQGCEFGLSEPRATLRNGNLIEVHLDFRLTSEFLGDLIDKGDAQYVVEVACPKTFIRFTRAVSAEVRLELEAGDYAEELFLTPQVVSSVPLADFITDEHTPEWCEHRPEGFNVPEAGVLAVGRVVRITIEETGVNSVIDLVGNTKVGDGMFHVELDGERIKIHVAPEDKERIESLRQRRAKSDTGFAGLFPSPLPIGGFRSFTAVARASECPLGIRHESRASAMRTGQRVPGPHSRTIPGVRSADP